jgi:hypothetical protein
MAKTVDALAVLVISDRRDQTVGSLAWPAITGAGCGAMTTITIAAGDTLPDLRGYDTVVADALILAEAPDVGSVRDWVDRGGSLIVVGLAGAAGAVTALEPRLAALTGLSSIGQALPGGEWFATVAASGHPVVHRSNHEFPVRGRFVPLETGARTCELLTVSVGHRNVCALAEHRLGGGRVVTCGLDLQPADDDSELGRILSRAQRRNERGQIVQSQVTPEPQDATRHRSVLSTHSWHRMILLPTSSAIRVEANPSSPLTACGGLLACCGAHRSNETIPATTNAQPARPSNRRHGFTPRITSSRAHQPRAATPVASAAVPAQVPAGTTQRRTTVAKKIHSGTLGNWAIVI